MKRSAGLAAFALPLVACGGGAPLLHPAHVLRPGVVEVGAGMSGEAAIQPIAGGNATLQELTVAPGVAPWLSGRVGAPYENEASLTYTGRDVRLGLRHAFEAGRLTISTGVGGSAIIGHAPGSGFDPSGVYGGGVDFPILLGVHSTSDLYSLWIGPRGGVEFVRGQLGVSDVGLPDEQVDPVKATHWFMGGLAGLRVGFRHVHVAIEGEVAYHHATGSLGGTPLALSQLAITPAGALLVEF